jgi:hypothetical protein
MGLPMRDESNQDAGTASPLVENLVVLLVLSRDHPEGSSINKLHQEIGYERQDITDAVGSLAAVGVVVLDGDGVPVGEPGGLDPK